MNRTVDFQFAIKIESGETLRAYGHVTAGGEFRLSHVWDDTPSGCLSYGFKYIKGSFTPEPEWSSVFDACPVWLSEYVNSDDFRKAVAAELRRISMRFNVAAQKVARPPRDEGVSDG